jgi:hypothetical protein
MFMQGFPQRGGVLEIPGISVENPHFSTFSTGLYTALFHSRPEIGYTERVYISCFDK